MPSQTTIYIRLQFYKLQGASKIITMHTLEHMYTRDQRIDMKVAISRRLRDSLRLPH